MNICNINIQLINEEYTCATICIRERISFNADFMLEDDSLVANEYNGATYKWIIEHDNKIMLETGFYSYNEIITDIYQPFNEFPFFNNSIGTGGISLVGEDFINIFNLLSLNNIFINNKSFSIYLIVKLNNQIKESVKITINGSY